MENSVLLAVIATVLSSSLLSRKEFYMTSEQTAGTGSAAACKAPPLEKNIVGTWHFKSNYSNVGSLNSLAAGTITFTAKGEIVDPDTLFHNYLDGLGLAISKTYKTNVVTTNVTYPGEYFVIYITARYGQQITPFTPIVNECKRIVLGLRASKDYRVRITLTK